MISVHPSQDPELGDVELSESQVKTTPARRRSSMSGAVGYALPPAVPIKSEPNKF